jgi:hypothetical protein
MLNINNDAVSQEELWGLIMKLADPSDLLRALLNSATDRLDDCPRKEATPAPCQTMIITDCNVTIHQHMVGGGPAPASAA